MNFLTKKTETNAHFLLQGLLFFIWTNHHHQCHRYIHTHKKKSHNKWNGAELGANLSAIGYALTEQLLVTNGAKLDNRKAVNKF